MSFLSLILLPLSILFPRSEEPASEAFPDLRDELPGIKQDTLRLPGDPAITGACFFRNEILYQKDKGGELFLRPGAHSTPDNSRPFSTNRSFIAAPSSTCFSSDFRTIYYSTLRSSESGFRELILSADLRDGQVSESSRLSFIQEDFRYLHPAVSADGSIMIFSSDQLPTNGGLDLFISRYMSNAWSKPESLGELINSTGHDCNPFLDGENNLWFSSSRQAGYGSYDLYVCIFNGSSWDAPRNLGREINTGENELGLSFSANENMALFSRAASTGKPGVVIRLQLDKNEITLNNYLLHHAESPEHPVKITPAKKPDIPDPDPDGKELLYRVQIKSAENAGTVTTVSIEGTEYTTYEYLYKGAYRITLGEFTTVDEANLFRARCKEAGFSQAFVAAFVDGVRETDPAIFKN